MRLSFLHFSLLATLAAPLSNAELVSAGQVHTCAWDGRIPSGIVCVGNNEHGQTEPKEPELLKAVREIRNPSVLASGVWHTCALHGEAGKNQITCWGYDGFGQGRAPQFEGTPLSLSVGRWHGCTILRKSATQTEAQCWGKNDYRQRDVPNHLRGTTAIFAGEDITCALAANTEVECWGKGLLHTRTHKKRFPSLRSATDFSCRLTGPENLDCWSNQVDGNPSYLKAVSKSETCIAVQGVLSCTEHASGQTTKHPFQGVSSLALGDWHGCAFHRQGLSCWGQDDEGRISFPPDAIQTGPHLRSVATLETFLEDVARYVYEHDKKFLLEVREKIKPEMTPEARYQLLWWLLPYLENLDYNTLKTDYLASVPATVKSWAVSFPDPHVLDERSLRLAYSLLAASLNASKALVTEADRMGLEGLLGRLAGQSGRQMKLTPALSKEVSDYALRNSVNPYFSSHAAFLLYLAEVLSPKG